MKTRTLTLKLFYILTFIISAGILSAQPLKPDISNIKFIHIADSLQRYLEGLAVIDKPIRLEDVKTGKDGRLLLEFSRELSEYPIREDDIIAIKNIVKRNIPNEFLGRKFIIKSANKTLEELSSTYFSGRESTVKSSKTHSQWVKNASRQIQCKNGLSNKIIALTPSHGWYYSNDENRWMWQRAPFFSTIEDLLTHDITVNYLAPMLENAGAYTTISRERDFNMEEIIVDNGSEFYNEEYLSSNAYRWEYSPVKGFSSDLGSSIKDNTNPFSNGTSRMVPLSKSGSTIASYLPVFGKSGEYGVYVSYSTLPNSTDCAEYTVRHSSGETKFRVNQKMGGGTWVYLGKFHFDKGAHGQGIIITNINCNDNSGDAIVTTDAVRFGGGMGNISRAGEISGMPRYAEGGRYWLQWCGFPYRVYSKFEGKNDYKDDYWSRGLWVNSLIEDFNVPVDLSLSVHSDAGKHLTDSIVGTLAIFSTKSSNKTKYSDGRSRTTSRELADIVQTQIVEDISSVFGIEWTRRGLWDKSYVEARIPEVPSLLIELFAHQNYSDMKYGTDPMFKFTVARSLYKGILKYLAYTGNYNYTVQPLPVANFSALLSTEKEGVVILNWEGREDPLEPSAAPACYILYTRVTDPSSGNWDTGFDNGRIINGTSAEIKLEEGKIYSFKIAAANNGGESFPSEVLSAGYLKGANKALIINNYYKTSSPSYFKSSLMQSNGYHPGIESGIPYKHDYSYVGGQYNFNKHQDWRTDWQPGFGASYIDYTREGVAGNSMDYPSIHGRAFLECGMSFSSSSVSILLEDNTPNLSEYKVLDIITGKENSPEKIFPLKLRKEISQFCRNSGSIIISGAYIGSSSSPYSNGVTPTSDLSALNASVLEHLNKAKILMEKSIKESQSITHKAVKSNDSLGYNYYETYITKNIIELQRQIIASAERNDSTISNIVKLSESISEIEKEVMEEYKIESFVSEILKTRWTNAFATSTGIIRRTSDSQDVYEIAVTPSPLTFCSESTDALAPADKAAYTWMRYNGSNNGAAIAYDGTDYRSIVFGFPLESITSHESINKLLCEAIKFLTASR